MAYPHEFLSVNASLFVVGMMLCILASAVLKHYQFAYLPECAAFILIGAVAGVIANFSTDSEQNFMAFSPNLVFFIMLPPIILDAGYRLKRQDFFEAFGLTLLLATVGTVINSLVFGYLLFAFAKVGWIPLDSTSPLECLLFGSIVSATDPVATLSLMGSKLVNVDPILYSLIMGESVLNDAIAIVLYKAFEQSVSVDEANDVIASSFSGTTLILSLLQFIGVSIGSVVCGFTIGLSCCLLCKRVNLPRFPLSELTIVSLFAFLSYYLAEMLYLSGIMSLFFAAICLAHYNYDNLTPVAQIAAHESFASLASVAETALYAFIGLTLGLSIQSSILKYHAPLAITTILICFIARAAHVFPLCALSNAYHQWSSNTAVNSSPVNGEDVSRQQQPAAVISKPADIPLAMQFPLWFAGLRGGISFALSLSFPGSRRPLVVGATLMLVIFSTFVCGGLTLPLLRRTGMTGNTAIGVRGAQRKLESQQSGDESKSTDLIAPVDEAQVHSRSSLIQLFKRLDEDYLQRYFSARRHVSEENVPSATPNQLTVQSSPSEVVAERSSSNRELSCESLSARSSPSLCTPAFHFEHSETLHSYPLSTCELVGEEDEVFCVMEFKSSIVSQDVEIVPSPIEVDHLVQNMQNHA